MVRIFIYVLLYICIYCLSRIIVDIVSSYRYMKSMNERKAFTTSLNVTILKEFKKLAIDLDKGINDLLEEAMKDLLKKYETKQQKK